MKKPGEMLGFFLTREKKLSQQFPLASFHQAGCRT
jgi:hypothetical protein